MSLWQMDQWDPNCIQATFSAVTDHSDSTRMTSDDLGRIMAGIPWKGRAHDAASGANTDIRRDLNLQAEVMDAVAKAAKAAEAQVRSIKSDWAHLQQEAAACGMTIDVVNNTVTYEKSSDPETARIQEENYKTICTEIGKLLKRADEADEDLAAAINGAVGKQSADEINREINDHWIADPDSAEEAVHDALGGDQTATNRVNDVLDSITAEQKAGTVPLTPEQASVLSQLQAQQNGMSITALQDVTGKLGDDGTRMLANSWQLMSNSKVRFPQTELRPGAKDNPNIVLQGSESLLPRSVQDALNSPGVLDMDDMQIVADITQGGDASFKVNTDLDRGILQKAAVVMDDPMWQSSSKEFDLKDPPIPWLDPVVSDMFSAVSDDHGAIHDAVTQGGSHISGIDSEKFLSGLTERVWADDGKAAGSLLEWTGNRTGPEAELAASTAQAYANHLGTNSDKLLHMGGGTHSLGEINPELVRAIGRGLEPYQGDMVGDNVDPNRGFHPLDDLGSNMSKTKGLFAVIDSDDIAANEWNTKAYEKVLAYHDSFADLVKQHPDLTGADPRADDLDSSARLLGAIDGGARMETSTEVANTKEALITQATDAYNNKKAWLDNVVPSVPVAEKVPDLVERLLLGRPPEASDFQVDQNGHITNTGLSATQQEVQHAATNAQYEIASRLFQGGEPHIDAEFFGPDGQLKPPSAIDATKWSLYDTQLRLALANYPQVNTSVTNFKTTFESLTDVE